MDSYDWADVAGLLRGVFGIKKECTEALAKLFEGRKVRPIVAETF